MEGGSHFLKNSASCWHWNIEGFHIKIQLPCFSLNSGLAFLEDNTQLEPALEVGLSPLRLSSCSLFSPWRLPSAPLAVPDAAPPPPPLSASPIRVTASTGQVYVIQIPHFKEHNCRGKYMDVSITTCGPPVNREQEVLHQEFCARESCSVENPPGVGTAKAGSDPRGLQTSHFTFLDLIFNSVKRIGALPVMHSGLQFQDPSRKPHRLQSKLTRGHSAAFQPDLCLWPWLDLFTCLCLGFSICKAIWAFLLTGETAMIWVKANWTEVGLKRI